MENYRWDVSNFAAFLVLQDEMMNKRKRSAPWITHNVSVPHAVTEIQATRPFQNRIWARKSGSSFQHCIKIISFNVWVRYFVWNFKGTLWNSTQNILPIHWEMYSLLRREDLRAPRFTSPQSFLTLPPLGLVSTNEKRCYICNIFSHWQRVCLAIDRKRALQSKFWANQRRLYKKITSSLTNWNLAQLHLIC